MESKPASKSADDWAFPSLHVQLPGWITAELPPPDHVYSTIQQRMELVIALARKNVEHGGGPFGAAVFDSVGGSLLAPGVNTVVASRWSGAHAEMVAIAIAQQAAQNHDLTAYGSHNYELVTSCEPCSMCFGATPWSGVKRLVCGAREEDALEIGFDEGPKPLEWVRTLEARGIAVVRDVLRDASRAVLQDYAAHGGEIYNARRNG